MTKIFISVILCRDEQSDPLKMFENPTSEAFEKFLDIMEVPKSKDDRTVWSRQGIDCNKVSFFLIARCHCDISCCDANEFRRDPSLNWKLPSCDIFSGIFV